LSGFDFGLPQKLQFVALRKHTFGARFTFKELNFASYPNTQVLFEIASGDEDVRLGLANAKPNRPLIFPFAYVIAIAFPLQSTYSTAL
jgi:hypothetical protein